MIRCLTLIGVCALAVVGAAQATELDHTRQLERAREDQRQAFELAFVRLRQEEPERIKAEGGHVIRNDGELAMQLGNGRWTYFHDNKVYCLSGVIPARNDGCAEFLFVGHPVPRFYVLRAHYYEGSDYRLVDETSGDITRIVAEPHFSPDGKRLVTVSAAVVYDPTGIQIWSVGAGKPSLVWQHAPAQYALYYFVRWAGNDEISLEVETYVKHQLKRLPAQLRFAAGAWTLIGPAEASQY